MTHDPLAPASVGFLCSRMACLLGARTVLGAGHMLRTYEGTTVMSAIDAVGRAYTHYLYLLRQAMPRAIEVPWDEPSSGVEGTTLRCWEEDDGTGHICVDLDAEDVHLIGIIGSLAALMNVLYDATQVDVAWTLNHERLPAVELTIFGRCIPDEWMDAEVRRAIVSRL